MKLFHMFFIAVFILVLLPNTVQSEGKISGVMFFDYYSVLKNHRPSLEGRHGFWARRIYLTYDSDLTERFKMRLRLEMTSPGDFVSNDKLVPAVKDAYLSYGTGNHTAMFGIIATPTWSHLEGFWGYRAVARTPLDLQGWGSSRDFGIGLRGDLNAGKTVSYWIMYGNGASNRGETNKGKKVYGQIAIKPVVDVFVDINGEYEHRQDNIAYSVCQAVAGIEKVWGRAGVQLARRCLSQNGEKMQWTLISVFSALKIAKTVETAVRFDKMFDANPDGERISYTPFSALAPSNLLIGLVSWQAVQNVWLIPNIKYVFYDTPSFGEKPSDDLYGNLTLFFRY